MYTKIELEKLYLEMGSIKKVADCLDRPYSTMHYWFDKYRIKRRKREGFPYSKYDLIKLHDEYGSITKVAAFLRRSYSTVRHWYGKYDIVVNASGMTVFQHIRNTPLTDIQKTVILGSILGDGGLWLAPHSKNARLYVVHCEKQKKYLEWVHDLLLPFSRPIKHCEKAGKKWVCGREVNASNFYRFWTIAHPDITCYFKKYYEKGKKRVKADMIDQMTLLAMAIWFNDDGSVRRDRKGMAISGTIATCSFTYSEHEILVEMVRKFFDGDITIKKHGGKNRNDLIISMSGKHYFVEFIEMMKSISPKCIHYKL